MLTSIKKSSEETAEDYLVGFEAEKMFLAMINGDESKRDAFVSEVTHQVEERNREKG